MNLLVSQCSSKRAYATKAEAKRILKARGWQGLKVYRCRNCSKFHVGHIRTRWIS